MARLIVCPHCSTASNGSEEMLGRPVRCPHCKATFLAEPSASTSPPPLPAPSVEPVVEPLVEDTPPIVRAPHRFGSRKAERPIERPRSRRRDDDDEDDPPPRRGVPILLPLLGGGALLLVVAVVGVVMALTRSSPSTPAVTQTIPLTDKPDTPNARPDPRVAPPVNNVVIPPLPPMEQRPTLVLDAGGHTATVKRVFVTPDQSRYITVSLDKTVRLWDASTGEAIYTYRLPVGLGAEGTLSAAAMSSNGKYLAVTGMPVGGGKHGVLIYLLSLENGELVRVFKGHRDTISSLAFSRDDRWLASGSNDDTGLIYKVETGQIAGELTGHTNGVYRIEFNPVDGRLATIDRAQTLRLWTANGGKFSNLSVKIDSPLISLAWHPNGQALAVGSIDGRIRLFSDKGEASNVLGPIGLVNPQNKLEPMHVVALRYTPDGTKLVYGGIVRKGLAGIIDVATGRGTLRFEQHSNTVQDVNISNDGKRIISTGGDDHESFVWNANDGSVVHQLSAAGRAIWGVGWSTDGKSIHFGHTNRHEGNLGLCPLERSFHLTTLNYEKPRAGLVRAQIRFDGYELKQRDLNTLDVLKDGRLYHTISNVRGRPERIYCASLLTNDRLVFGSGLGQLYLYDLKKKEMLREFHGHSSSVLCVTPSPDGTMLLSGSADQTMAMWRLDRSEPVLSFFPVGQEWIAWTPEGYYAASSNGERLMGWQINNGPEQLGRFFPAIRFHASLYQPVVVRQLFRTNGDLAQAVALAAKELNKPLAGVNVTQILPPSVTITSPKVGANGAFKTNQPNMQVTASARSTGNHAVKSMRLLLDGRPYGGANSLKVIDNPAAGEVSVSWNVVLPPGQHTLSVLADAGVSKGLSAPVAVALDQNGRLPNLYVVAIGISAYAGPLRLNFAATDAQNMARILKEKTRGVFGNVEVALLVDQQGTKANILNGLDWLKEKMTVEDVGIFYFSGHGARDEDEEQFYLVPVDVGRNLAQTGVNGDIVRDRLAALPGKLIAILDACHSGAVADSFKAGRVDGLVRDLVSDDNGVIVMCSSLSSEVSLEGGFVRGGFFTTSLLEGLNGRADLNRDNSIGIHELDVYASARTRQLSRGEQNSVTGRPPNIRPFPIARP